MNRYAYGEGWVVDPIVVAAGTALVSAMAAMCGSRLGPVWWRCGGGVHPQQADTVEADLEGLRAQVLDVRQTGRVDTELALMGVWQGRLHQLLLDEPAVAAELRRVLDETLIPVLMPLEQSRIGTLIMRGSSRDSSTSTRSPVTRSPTGRDHRLAGGGRAW